MINQCQHKSAPTHCKKDSLCPCTYGAALPPGENTPRRYRIETTDGQVTIAEYQVFPGIWLVRHRANAHSFQYITGHPQNLLEITHCREGRLEFEEENRFFLPWRGRHVGSPQRWQPRHLALPHRLLRRRIHPN
nr:hypothetical protein [uncultured Agathobaculum sp.]